MVREMQWLSPGSFRMILEVFMSNFLVIISLVSISFSSFAGNALKCSVEITGSEKKSEIEVQANKGLLPISLGNGKKLRIVFFNDDVRFTELRPLTDAELAEVNQGPGQPYVEGKIVAHSQVAAKGDVSSAMFVTADVEVLCDIVE